MTEHKPLKLSDYGSQYIRSELQSLERQITQLTLEESRCALTSIMLLLGGPDACTNCGSTDRLNYHSYLYDVCSKCGQFYDAAVKTDKQQLLAKLYSD